MDIIPAVEVGKEIPIRDRVPIKNTQQRNRYKQQRPVRGGRISYAVDKIYPPALNGFPDDIS